MEPQSETIREPATHQRNTRVSFWSSATWSIAELAVLVLLFFSFSPGVPGVNEPHYLCKAKHFWDQEFCPGDVFLESADAHYLFYFTLGLLTKFLSLSQAAWAGRFICWVAIAAGWSYFVRSLTGQRFWSILAAGLFLLGVEYCHFAGEWLIGGTEAKGLAYAFVFAGMGFLVQRRWTPVWCLFGLGAAFHVLVGGWAVVAGLATWVGCRGWKSNWKAQLVSGAIGLLFSLVGLVPALVLTVGQDAQIVARANEIYTFERIAHHLVFSHIAETSPQRLDFFVMALMTWIGLLWVVWESKPFRILSCFVFATVLIAGVAFLIEDYAFRSNQPEMAASLLRYYWFRLSDIFVPAGVALGLTLAIKKCFSIRYDVGAIGVAIASVLVIAHVTTTQINRALRQRSQADELTLPSFDEAPELNKRIVRDWIDVCSWIRTQTPTSSRFITPRAQSTFKWYAHRSEVVNWKDVPQDAVGIVNWRNRFTRVFGSETYRFGLASLNAERELIRLREEYDAQYLVIERRHVRERKNELEFRYRYRQYLLGNENMSTPFDKPLCLKQIYPNSSHSKQFRKESVYLVYEIQIPEQYQPQVAAIDELLDWYQEYERQVEQWRMNESPAQ